VAAGEGWVAAGRAAETGSHRAAAAAMAAEAVMWAATGWVAAMRVAAAAAATLAVGGQNVRSMICPSLISPLSAASAPMSRARTGGRDVCVSWNTVVRVYQSVVVRTMNAVIVTLVPTVGGTNDIVSAVWRLLSVWATPQVLRIWPRLGAVMTPLVGDWSSQPRK
jgi:hypothetical protein